MPEDPPEAAMLRQALAGVGRVRLRTRGTSMLPAIAPGTLVTVEARPLPQVVPGDVAAVVIDARIIVHRVVEVSAAGLLTLGDGLPLLDPHVAPDAYLGVVPGCCGGPPRQPDLAVLGPRPEGDGPGRIRLLVPGPVAAPPARGVDVRQCANPGRLPAPVIAISPYGALPPGTLDTVFRAVGGYDVTVLVGYSFGYGDPHGKGAEARTGRAGTDGAGKDGAGKDGAWELLPPDTADFHIRFGTPLDPPSTAAVLGFVADRVRARRAAPPSAEAAPATTVPVNAFAAGSHR